MRIKDNNLEIKKDTDIDRLPEKSWHKAKKYLGQNFLKSEMVLKKICQVANLSSEDIVLEIGPGKGVLTKKLLEKTSKVLAVEKDLDLVKLLQNKFAKEIYEKKLILINDDILNFSLEKNNLKKTNYKIVANIPYNITGAILKKFLTEVRQPEEMVLLVQKEVAERIVSRNNKESILSLSIKIYGTPKYIIKVPKRYFSPNPKVDSALIIISNISRKKIINKEQEKIYFNLIKAGFSHKRKILLKNLQTGYRDFEWEKIFEGLKIDKKIRAEDLSFSVWQKISEECIKN